MLASRMAGWYAGLLELFLCAPHQHAGQPPKAGKSQSRRIQAPCFRSIKLGLQQYFFCFPFLLILPSSSSSSCTSLQVSLKLPPIFPSSTFFSDFLLSLLPLPFPWLFLPCSFYFSSLSPFLNLSSLPLDSFTTPIPPPSWPLPCPQATPHTLPPEQCCLLLPWKLLSRLQSFPRSQMAKDQ